MNKYFEKVILKSTNSKEIVEIHEIQDLWGGYGKIFRCILSRSLLKSVIVKNVRLPDKRSNQDSDISYRRKLKSYKVEMEFYKNWSKKCNEDCRVADWYAFEWQNNEFLMVFEDLDLAGFKGRMSSVTWNEVKLCLKWLANFHAAFMGEKPEGLWSKGTYWHLETRPDELKALRDMRLKNAAKKMDAKLDGCKFKTFVHGDAKIANFCFSEDRSRVAAVDFQYVGGGCGMKDVAYFIDSCLYDEECEALEGDILDFYFGELEKALKIRGKDIDFDALEKEWRELYYVAWADFYRFFKGWALGHYEGKYSERVINKVIESLNM